MTKIMFEKLEMAYSYEASSTTDALTHYRGFHVMFGSLPPKAGESLYDYVFRMNIEDTGTMTDADNRTMLGFSLFNTPSGIKCCSLHELQAHTSGSGTLRLNAVAFSKTITATNAYITNLTADTARITNLDVDTITVSVRTNITGDCIINHGAHN